MNLINQLTMSSREIAELTGTRHDSVKRTMQSLAEKQIITFSQSVEKGEGRPVELFHVDKRNSLVVVARVSPEFTAAVVDRWQELESQQAIAELPDFSNPVAAARAWADEAEQKQLAQQALAIAAPKADFYDAVTGSDDCIDMAAAAKTLAIKGMGRTKLFKFLRDHKILQKNNQPYQEQVDAGRFRVIESKWTDGNGDTHINLKTVVYQKGLDYIRKLIDKEQER